MGRAAGIDYGSHSLKVASVRWSGRRVALVKAALVPTGFEGDGEALAGAVAQKGLRLGGGIYGVSGRDSILRYTHVPPVPPWRMKLIMDYEIGEIAAKGGGNISADYQLLNVPRDVSQDLTIIVGMAKDERVSSRIDLLEKAGLGARAALPTSVALFNAYRFLGPEVEEAALLVDIGHENMDIAISQAGHLIFARSVQLGGKDFTEAIASALGVPFAEAERIKHKRGAIRREGWKDPADRSISDALMGVVANLLSVIQSSVSFCKAQTKIRDLSIEQVFLSGGGARLEGLAEHLGNSMKMPVEIFDPLARASLEALPPETRDEVRAHSLEYTIPIGLALSEDPTDAFRLDLLPTRLKARREFRTRTIFLYGAGLIVGLALILNLIGAIGARWGEGKRGKRLEETLIAVQERHDDWETLRKANEQRKAELEALAWETRSGYFLSVLLDAIGTRTPSQIEISSIEIEWEGKGEKETRSRTPFHYRVAGASDDATGTGFRILEGYQKSLDAVPEFASVRIDADRTKHDLKAGVWRFELVATPIEGQLSR